MYKFSDCLFFGIDPDLNTWQIMNENESIV